jgi:5'-methylthioadenosine phosphorylase
MIGIIGGSGFYELLTDARTVEVDTPYGPPSDPIAIGRLGDTEVAFLARHGAGHRHSPARVPYRANLWALASLGVHAVLASSAVGGLSPATPTGSFVVPDQLLDRTRDRPDTYFDDDSGVQHLPFAEPFCPALRGALIIALTDSGEAFAPTGTTVVIGGPRFSTKAESAVWRQSGADIINMTQYPEAALAAELGMGYAALSFVTDADTGHEAEAEAVTAEVVFRRLLDAKPRIVAILERAVHAIPADYAPRTLIDPAASAAVLARPVRPAP